MPLIVELSFEVYAVKLCIIVLLAYTFKHRAHYLQFEDYVHILFLCFLKIESKQTCNHGDTVNF